VTETERDVAIRAEVPGFDASELAVSVEPRRLTITGKRETKEDQKQKGTIYTERSFTEILRTLELPAVVETEKAEASLKDGILEVRIAKATAPRRVEIAAKGSKEKD
jgi:HSP20 family protein